MGIMASWLIIVTGLIYAVCAIDLAGKGNIAAGSQALADQQKKQEEEKAKQQAGKAQQPQQAQQAQQPQQAPAAPAEKPEYAPVQNTT